jgi:hypothetical protein
MKFIAAVVAFLICTVVPATVSSQAVPDSVRKYEREGLPTLRPGQGLDPKRGIPVPQGAQVDGSGVSVVARPETDDERTALRSAAQIANAAPQIKTLLASNGRLLAGGLLPAPLEAGAAPDPRYLFTYYNYQKERAVEVLVAKGQVLDLREREQGFQPPASPEETRAASDAVGPRFTASVSPESVRALAFAGPDGKRQLFIYGESASRQTTATVVSASKQVLKFQSSERLLK